MIHKSQKYNLKIETFSILNGFGVLVLGTRCLILVSLSSSITIYAKLVQAKTIQVMNWCINFTPNYWPNVNYIFIKSTTCTICLMAESFQRRQEIRKCNKIVGNIRSHLLLLLLLLLLSFVSFLLYFTRFICFCLFVCCCAAFFVCCC